MNIHPNRLLLALMIGIILILLICTLGLYFKTYGFEFVNFDDSVYVYENSIFENRINNATIMECFTKIIAGNWHPLTMFSYGIDVWLAQQLGWWKIGLLQDQISAVAGIFHLHNALLHAFNSVLLFIFLFLLIRGPQQRLNFPSCKPSTLIIVSAAAAAFWAWHPLRVESVAWVSSRKDVVCIFWFLLGHIIYLNEVLYRASSGKIYVRDRRYWVGIVLTCITYILSFMGKPTAVVYPFTLLLMELMFIGIQGIIYRRWCFYIGLLMITSVFCGIVLICQEAAIGNVPAPLFMRLLNAMVSIGAYIGTTIFPFYLSVFYVYGESFSFIQLIFGAWVCGILTWVVYPFIKQIKMDIQQGLRSVPAGIEKEYLTDRKIVLGALGTSWFLITLIPVIGIIQVGDACRADRYTYLSGIGLSIGMCMVLLAIMKRITFVWLYYVLGLMTCVGVCIFFAFTYHQIDVWRDDFHLYHHALVLNPENGIAHGNLGVRLIEEKRFNEALPHICMYGVFYKNNTLIKNLLSALVNIEKGQCKIIKSEEIFNINIADNDPRAMEKHWAYSLIAVMRGCYALAESEIKKALSINAQNGYMYHTLAIILIATEGRESEALSAYKTSLELLPSGTYLGPQIRRSIRALEEKVTRTE